MPLLNPVTAYLFERSAFLRNMESSRPSFYFVVCTHAHGLETGVRPQKARVQRAGNPSLATGLRKNTVPQNLTHVGPINVAAHMKT